MKFPLSLAITEETFRPGDAWLVDFVNQYVVPAMTAASQGESVPVHVLDKPFPHRHKPLNMPGVTTAARIILSAARTLQVPGQTLFLTSNIRHPWTMDDFPRKDPADYRGVHNSVSALATMMKRTGKERLFLPGRDVWPWAAMAAARGIPFTYVPGISRKVSQDPNFGAFLTQVFGVNYLRDCLGFDTGFAGSIFTRVGKVLDTRIAWVLFSADKGIHRPEGSFGINSPSWGAPKNAVQVFPTMPGCRHAALAIEDAPKILKSGSSVSPDGNSIVQYVDAPFSIAQCGIETCRMFYGGAKLNWTKEPSPPTTNMWGEFTKTRHRAHKYKESFAVEG